MIYFDVRSIGDLINEFYEQYKGPGYVDELKVLSSWNNVVGSFIASHTIDLSIKNKVLFARIDSDALRNELNYSKSLLLKSLNDIVGKEVITEIVLN